MTTAIAQAFANIAFIKYWGNIERFTSSRKPTISMLWTKDRTLFGRYFPQNLAFIEYSDETHGRTNCKVRFGSKFVFS
jgi:hypothetical protein